MDDDSNEEANNTNIIQQKNNQLEPMYDDELVEVSYDAQPSETKLATNDNVIPDELARLLHVSYSAIAPFGFLTPAKLMEPYCQSIEDPEAETKRENSYRGG